jgi:hypothetical protein
MRNWVSADSEEVEATGGSFLLTLPSRTDAHGLKVEQAK